MEQPNNNPTTPNPPPFQYNINPGDPGPLYIEPQNSVFAIISLVGGIAGFFIVPVIGQIIGIIFGHMALNEIKNANGRLTGRSLAMAGLITSYIGLGLIVLVILFFIVMVTILYASGAPGNLR